MPNKDPRKRKEYNEIYRRTDKGAASLKAGKRRHWEKVKADPVRLELSRSKVREAMRVRRLHPDTKAKENARWRERWAARKQKPMKALEVERKKTWVSARRQPLFVVNKRTIGRARKRRIKRELPACDHNQGFRFKMTDVGMRRTCNTCGRSFTEVAKK